MNNELMVCATSDIGEALLCTPSDAKQLDAMTECWLWDGEEVSEVRKPIAVWTKFVIMEHSVYPPRPTSEVLGRAIEQPN